MSTDVQEPPPEAAEADEEIASEVALAAPEVIADSLGEYVKIWIARVRNGESGALPVILGLVAIVIYFQVRSSLFLSAGNLVNLIAQAAWIMTLGMAEVFVLLLGEIDLSIGYTAALGATFTCWLLLPPNPAPWPLAVLVGLAVPAVFSGLEGLIVTRLRLPSFVVTLAGQLPALGLLLEVMNSAAPNGGGTHPAVQQRPGRHRVRLPQPAGRLDRHDRGRGAGRRAVPRARHPPAGEQSRRASAERDLAEDRRDGGRGRGRGADRQHQPRRRPPRGARRAVGGAGGPGGARRLELPARPHPVRPVYLRHRRQRRGGPAGRHQPEPDPGPRVHAVRADRGHHGHHLHLLPRLDLHRRPGRPATSCSPSPPRSSAASACSAAAARWWARSSAGSSSP